ncbi:uncharacterized protein LOC143842238 [Paroedura picta]|uniref:uncharacterized protein LOC143842238 n=1 Tax=Paroedura picta TaxID=143630 RepID=UPI00405768D0
MRPSKRTNTNSNLIVCGAPDKKVPKAPVPKQDSSKPALWKAFEAVVAAGRRGLLGPAAMAAVEAMPDTELGCCDGEIAQETPSSTLLMEEKAEEKVEEEGKKEEKSEKIKCNTVVTARPSLMGSRRWKFTQKEIWICGNYVISSTRRRAQSVCYGPRLGLPHSTATISWHGVPRMMWNDLLPILHHIYHSRSFPYIIVIHVGESDLLTDSSSSLVTKMQNDLSILRTAFPKVAIIWSSLLPKHFWKPSEDSQVVESERNKVNCKMEEYCNETGICYLSHPLITGDNECLFLPDNTLSYAGADIFIIDLRKVLNTCLVFNQRNNAPLWKLF